MMPRKFSPSERFIYMGVDPESHRLLRHMAVEADVSVTEFMKEVVREYLEVRGLLPQPPVQGEQQQG